MHMLAAASDSRRRTPGIPAWDTLDADHKKVAGRRGRSRYVSRGIFLRPMEMAFQAFVRAMISSRSGF
jgi:hypothetical protein